MRKNLRPDIRRGMPGTTSTPHTTKVAPRQTECEWAFVALNEPKVVTGVEGEAALDKTAYLRRALGFVDAEHKRDRRPVLVYFHWPHKDARHGKQATKICDRLLEDEAVARWSRLFRGVRVEMERSDAKLAKDLGAKDGPAFAVLDAKLRVLTRIAGVKSSPKLAKELARALALDPDAQRRMKADVEAQRQFFASAQALFDLERDAHARHFVDRILASNTRVDPVYNKALELSKRLDARKARNDRQ